MKPSMLISKEQEYKLYSGMLNLNSYTKISCRQYKILSVFSAIDADEAFH